MVISDFFLMSFDETRIFHKFEILGSHAQITEMKFTRAIGRTGVFARGIA